MTTPVSLQPWSWQIFILIKLWWQVFQMVVYGDIVDTQTWYWPWNLTVSSHLHMPVRPMCNTALLSFRLFRKNLGNLRDFFGQMVYRPPWQKNFPYAYEWNITTFYSARRNSKKIYSYQYACKAEKTNWGRKHFLFRQPGFFKCWPLSRYPPSLLALKDCLNNSRVCPLKCHVVLLLPNQS